MLQKPKYDWEVGKIYKTKGGLQARITKIKERPIPKETDSKTLEELSRKSFFGIEGVLIFKSSDIKDKRIAWTLEGVHCTYEESTGMADLTTEEVSETN